MWLIAGERADGWRKEGGGGLVLVSRGDSDLENMMLVCFCVGIVQWVVCWCNIVRWGIVWYNGG